MGWKYKYSVRFQNEEGEWQEQDALEHATEALRIKEHLQSQGKITKVIDLESDTELA